jgi:uncharacterized phage protein (TIGR02220 family)
MQKSLQLTSDLVNYIESLDTDSRLKLLDWLIELSRDNAFTPAQINSMSNEQKNMFDRLCSLLKFKRTKVKDNSLIIAEVVGYFNEVTGKSMRPQNKTWVKNINSILDQGFALADMKKVIDNKTAEWLHTDQCIYLRPETLFGSKFESYLNEKGNGAKPQQRSTFTAIHQSIEGYINKQRGNATDN